MMENDDVQVGVVLSRREALKLMAAASAAALAACAPETPAALLPTSAPAQSPTSVPQAPAIDAPAEDGAEVSEASSLPSCIVRPEQTAGPFFVDGALNRADIRSDPATGATSEGAPLRLAIRVSRLDGTACTPLSGAQVDVWHCDAQGVYSGVQDANAPAGSAEQLFLRGQQATGEGGAAEFQTIYPGWYRGRAVHVHFTIRAAGEGGAVHAFTSQLYFDDATNDAVFQQAPYAARGTGWLPNAADGLYANGGDQLLLDVTQDGDGYAATFDIGLQMG